MSDNNPSEIVSIGNFRVGDRIVGKVGVFKGATGTIMGFKTNSILFKNYPWVVVKWDNDCNLPKSTKLENIEKLNEI